MQLDFLLERIAQTVESHRLSEGAYARWLYKNGTHECDCAPNEYGCADAANLLYTIGAFVREPQARAKWVAILQGMAGGGYRPVLRANAPSAAHHRALRGPRWSCSINVPPIRSPRWRHTARVRDCSPCWKGWIGWAIPGRNRTKARACLPR